MFAQMRGTEELDARGTVNLLCVVQQRGGVALATTAREGAGLEGSDPNHAYRFIASQICVYVTNVICNAAEVTDVSWTYAVLHGSFYAVLHPMEIPQLDPHTPCRECQRFLRQILEVRHQRDSLLERAFETTEIVEVEQQFQNDYSSVFRCWMEHKLTHESGSLRRYVAILAQSQ
jgi:hypothetical protein